MKKLIPAVLISLTAALPVAADELTDETFKYLDTDKNGSVSLNEFRGVEAGDETQKCSVELLEKVDSQLIGIFAKLDGNDDKNLSKKEFSEKGLALYDDYWRAQFTVSDNDKDKAMSKKEYEAYVDADVKRFNETYATDRYSKDCKGDFDAWSEFYKGYKKYAMSYFKELDDNKDGSLSVAEFKAEHLWK